MFKILKSFSINKFQIRNRSQFCKIVQLKQEHDIPTLIAMKLKNASDLINLKDYQNDTDIYYKACQEIKDVMEHIHHFDQKQLCNVSFYLNNLNIENEDYIFNIKTKVYQLMRMKLIDSKLVINIIDNQLSEDLDEQELIQFNKYIQPDLQNLNQDEISCLVPLYTKLYHEDFNKIWLDILYQSEEATRNMNMAQIFTITQGLSLSQQIQLPQNDQLWDIIQNRIKDLLPYQFNHNFLAGIIQSFSCIEKGDEQLWTILKQKTFENLDLIDINDICRILEGVKLNTQQQEFFFTNLESQVIDKIDQIIPDQLVALISGYSFSQLGSDQIWYLLDQKLQEHLDSLDKEKYLLLLISVINRSNFLQKTTINSVFEKYYQFQYSIHEKKSLKKYFLEIEVDPVIIDTYFKDLAEI